MSHRPYRNALAILLLPGSLLARQSAAVPPAPAPASAPCAAPEFHQFDFWVGMWNVVDPRGEPAGVNQVQSILRGCVVQEHWSGTEGETGTSFNIFDARTKKWHQSWVDSHGQLLLLDGGFRDGKMVLEGRRPGAQGGFVLDRITWQRIGADPDRVRQLWESSRDGGKSWQVVFDGAYIRGS